MDDVVDQIVRTAVRLELLVAAAETGAAQTVELGSTVAAQVDDSVAQTGHSFVTAALFVERDHLVGFDEPEKSRNRPETPLALPMWERESSQSLLQKEQAVLEFEQRCYRTHPIVAVVAVAVTVVDSLAHQSQQTSLPPLDDQASSAEEAVGDWRQVSEPSSVEAQELAAVAAVQAIFAAAAVVVHYRPLHTTHDPYTFAESTREPISDLDCP